MNALVISPKLQSIIDSFITHPMHALVVYGPQHSGKRALIEYIADAITNSRPGSKYHIEPQEGKKSIGYDDIKDIKHFVRVKDNLYRVVLIPDAELLTIEAQNSLLKLLEEPPKKVIFILSSVNLHDLLPTVQSRLSKMQYIAPTSSQVDEYIAQTGAIDASKIKVIANGRMGLLHALCYDDNDHIMLRNIDVAKDILMESKEDRLLRVDGLVKDAKEIKNLLDAMSLVCNAALEASINKDTDYRQWLNRMTYISEAFTQIEHNVLPKLVLGRLFLVL